MLFNVQEDQRQRITGYFVPDSFSSRGHVRVSSQGLELAVIGTNELCMSLVVAGRHETGLCGFSIDEAAVPGLGALSHVEVSDAETGTLIYCRAPAEAVVPLKLLRIETHMIPLRRVDRAVAGRFAYSYIDAERAGLESSMQMFHLNHAQSLYVAGRLSYKPFESLIMRGFQTLCMINDPYEELAERILLLRHAAQRPGLLELRDALAFEAAIDFAAGIELGNDKELRRNFERVDTDAAAPLTSPLVRQLTTRTGSEMPHSGFLATALDVLASCIIVGRRDDSRSFASALADLLGMTVESVPAVRRRAAAIRLAERLKPIRAVQDLLEFDLVVYYQVVEAFKKAS
jgi:hypothetical protein